MGRKRKYKESTTKTITAQKEASKAYYNRNKNKYGTISITQTAEQTQADKDMLKSHGLRPLQFWRWAIDKLNAEPLPASDSANSDDTNNE